MQVPDIGLTGSEESTASQKFLLEQLTIGELLQLHRELTDRLKAYGDLTSLNVHETMVLQVRSLQEMASTIQNDKMVPANQRAQVMNSYTSMLQFLAKMQNELYDSERMKVVEQCLVAVMKEQPPEVREKFIDLYTQRVSALNV